MNLETLTAFADKEIQKRSGSLKDFQATHLAIFKKEGLVPKVIDSYKFTKPEAFFQDGSSSEKIETQCLNNHFPTIEFTNGVFTKNDLKISGVTVKGLKENFDEVKGFFKDENALSHLQHALLTDGVIIEVAKNIGVGFPLKIKHSVSSESVSAPVVIVILHHFAKLNLIEEVVGTTSSYTHLSETYLDVRDGAKVEHILLGQEAPEGIQHTSVYANVGKDATARSFIFNTSGKLNRKNLTLNLTAPGAHGESFALYLTNKTEHSDVNTVINHQAPDSTSDQIAKGILDGESKGIFTGKIHILPKAQRVASGQLNKNLLLSKKAQAHSQPQLEIFADDVKCSHGSTTGQLSPDEVFYFQARGIPEEKARTLLAHGFGLEVVQKIENEEARKAIAGFVMKTLETKFELRGMK